MAITCPNCDHRLGLRTPKPGRFRPKCPNCGVPFVLVVPEHAGAALQARAVAAETVAGARSGRPAAPLIFDPTPVPELADGQLSVVGAPAAGAKPDDSRPSGDRTEADGPAGDFIPPKARVRGYEIERELGRGGMGAVYLARQLSLDRPVALKVMGRKWAGDPVFVARFTREAYAAAQLSHPNIVHIHDIGEDDGTRFFSMEYVRGRSLADLVKAHGKLDPETAVGYVLQAARGLRHAHDRGMIHRDVKPDNLLLDENGLVKVADLGLVKIPAGPPDDDRPADSSRGGLLSLPANMTGAKIALGTPAYMSPEQCRDAASVDHRADVYSLGCTLYVLVTGRPPFDGTTAVEVMSKHAYDPIVPPEQIAGRVPKELSAVIQRMMAKDPNDRFQSMGEVIRTLETWLGVGHGCTFSPEEDQIAKLETYVRRFNAAPAAVLRRRLVTAFFAGLALAAVLVTFFGSVAWAFGLAALGVQAALAYFVIDGVTRRGHLFRRTREFAAGLTWGDWAVAAAVLVLFGILLAVLKLLWIWSGFGVIGLGLAFALRYALDRPAAGQRRPTLEAAGRLLRRLGMQGLDEEDLRQFVAKFAGRDWEEFFEALFGYEAKLAARAVLLRGGSAGVREKHAAWREPLIGLMDRIEKARRSARERQLLQAVERAQLVAAGAAPDAAEDRARAKAEAMVRAAGQARADEERRAATGPTVAGGGPPVNVRQAVAAAAESPVAVTPPPTRDPLGSVAGFFVGPHVRAVAAAVLLAGCALWVYQNGLLPGYAARAEAARAVEDRALGGLFRSAAANLGRPTRPLEIVGVPPAATAWLDGWNAGVAGLILLASLFHRGNVMSAFVLLGAAVIAVGHQHGIRTVEPFRAEHVGLILGSVLALVGFRAAR